MISFYPGPSRVHDEIPMYVRDAAKLGIMSINHRSDEFVKISKKTITLLQQKLKVPKNYTVFFVSSATECWEIIAQSWVTEKSYHLFNGAFGQKWFEYTKRIKPGATDLPFDREQSIDVKKLIIEKENAVIALTQNETSNGTQVNPSIIQKIKKDNPQHLVAVDATSSMAGIALDFKTADIWFASVQKCFGLPAGMALMICSPQAIAQAQVIGENTHYNSVPFMVSMMEKWQTPYTPNVLSIYLLMRVLEKSKSIREIDQQTNERYTKWIQFLDTCTGIRHLIKNKQVRSATVIPVISDTGHDLQKIKSSLKKKGFLVGEGYGEWKATTFRIANFPAIKNSEIASFKKALAEII